MTLEAECYLKGVGPHELTFVYTYTQYRPVPYVGVDVYIGLDRS